MSKLWGGRFCQATDKTVEHFTRSIHYDQQLAKFDCWGSLAHIHVLKQAGLLKQLEFHQLQTGLNKILDMIEKGTFKPDQTFEDIHSYIQSLLEKPGYAGSAALKLHTCRSRNDQVVLDTKWYCLEQLLKTEKNLLAYMKGLHELGQQYAQVIMPGFTHLQHAIPVAFPLYCDAFIQMAERDEERLLRIYNSIQLTMGSGALAGTFLPADFYNQTIHPDWKKEISPATNSLDTVSDRDFIIEILSSLAITGMHLSRLSEDIILWCTTEFNFAELSDAFCTGSSLMPQKKNPDVLELIRGYTGRLYGNLVSVLVVMKGLPMTYNRDMQLDKEPLFDSFRIIQESLQVLASLLGHIQLKEDNIRKHLDDESLYATDMADYLVQNKVPFKQAHHLIGQLIQLKNSSGTDIKSMEDKALQQIHPLLNQKIIQDILKPEKSVKSKKSLKKRKKNFNA
ncbi:MAG: argininosuccinate lyase [Candidatus Omnitrophota bacterium]|jgi:argininosuccinate lyase